MNKAQTMVEKILSNKIKKDVYAGDMIISPIDLAFAHDGTLPLAIEKMEEMGTTKVFNKDRVLVICDHASPSPSEKVSNVHIMMRRFARENRLNLYENGDGICHQIVLEKFSAPYKVIVGADSHTCTHGGLGAFSTGMGSTDIAAAMIYGKTWFKIPEAYKIEVNGALKHNVFSKDLFLYIAGKIGADGATYMSLEFLGSTIKDMSIESRLTMTNMAIEVGAKCGIMEGDEKTREFLRRYGREKEFKEVSPDKDAVYRDELYIVSEDVEPMIAYPHKVDNVAPVSDFAGLDIDQVCIGSCTNGRLEDLRIAAKILKGKKSKCRLVVYPASRDVLLKAIKDGLIDIFVEAGAAVCPPGCGFCIGRTIALGDGEVVLSTQNRNFKGRMGNNNAEIYLCSPATAAVSALNGKITYPEGD
ncbi:MAG: 3-isopropylmalate dehydratase large subunit [Candidatus Methanoliparum thermophilum]|uniref:3-isopropylmalate dehydratase large subunit n=1 Tax=Methanoliparum thermophilum TaxID=2491083 RepID=A0A520KRQ6_METT2|nr:3-isopropylmalate dehydratase large subunit [Candidatus Methanoliparum sp. LAM-1]RZN63829.1 MAG: 3-isopropylmalate dehydratase large subunit [Candidatus Methanoliparum thermophilum]BDC36447.1 3-isopropylmalate dehydratase large subunit 1 [Candidatus Methanoliparum sp. LAM-1]